VSRRYASSVPGSICASSRRSASVSCPHRHGKYQSNVLCALCGVATPETVVSSCALALQVLWCLHSLQPLLPQHPVIRLIPPCCCHGKLLLTISGQGCWSRRLTVVGEPLILWARTPVLSAAAIAFPAAPPMNDGRWSFLALGGSLPLPTHSCLAERLMNTSVFTENPKWSLRNNKCEKLPSNSYISCSPKPSKGSLNGSPAYKPGTSSQQSWSRALDYPAYCAGVKDPMLARKEEPYTSVAAGCGGCVECFRAGEVRGAGLLLRFMEAWRRELEEAL
jgi:hypothetical protein